MIKNFLKTIKSFILPIAGSGSLAMYQRIIVIGEWICVTSLLLAILFASINEKYTILILTKELCIGLFCSMVVVVVTSVLQFMSKREEYFRDFYVHCFTVVYFYNELLHKQRVKDEEEASNIYTSLRNAVDKCQAVPLLFWFSVKKEEAYIEVFNALTTVYLEILKYERIDNTEENKKLVKSVVENMLVISDKYYSSEINLFKLKSF